LRGTSLARQGSSKRADLESVPIEEHWAANVVPRRPAGAHKWSVGGVVVVAGSPAYAGAAALCCAGAGRSGAGIISAALTRSIAHVVVGLVPEVTVIILPEGEGASVAQRAAEAIAKRLERSKAMVVGPGLGDDEATATLLAALFGFARIKGGIGFGSGGGAAGSDTEDSLLARSGIPVVVDADALNWLAGQANWWERVPSERLVLTPHAGELARLLDMPIEDVLAEPRAVARDAAMRWGQTLVLKGAPTLVASADGSLAAADSPASLATAGSGDVLSGSISALLAQGLSGPDAAGLAVFIGSRAAKRVERRFGTLGVVASDLPDAIAEELRVLEDLGSHHE
jgi:NAD(P)H-hydrate repair Nnr-like enzyme with NAD(P)H-hydrate dehydratase domain